MEELSSRQLLDSISDCIGIYHNTIQKKNFPPYSLSCSASERSVEESADASLGEERTGESTSDRSFSKFEESCTACDPSFVSECENRRMNVLQWLHSLSPVQRMSALLIKDKLWVGLVLSMRRKLLSDGHGFFIVLDDFPSENSFQESMSSNSNHIQTGAKPKQSPNSNSTKTGIKQKKNSHHKTQKNVRKPERSPTKIMTPPQFCYRRANGLMDRLEVQKEAESMLLASCLLFSSSEGLQVKESKLLNCHEHDLTDIESDSPLDILILTETLLKNVTLFVQLMDEFSWGQFLRQKEPSFDSPWEEQPWLSSLGYYSLASFITNRIELALWNSFKSLNSFRDKKTLLNFHSKAGKYPKSSNKNNVLSPASVLKINSFIERKWNFMEWWDKLLPAVRRNVLCSTVTKLAKDKVLRVVNRVKLFETIKKEKSVIDKANFAKNQPGLIKNVFSSSLKLQKIYEKSCTQCNFVYLSNQSNEAQLISFYSGSIPSNTSPWLTGLLLLLEISENLLFDQNYSTFFNHRKTNELLYAGNVSDEKEIKDTVSIERKIYGDERLFFHHLNREGACKISDSIMFHVRQQISKLWESYLFAEINGLQDDKNLKNIDSSHPDESKKGRKVKKQKKKEKSVKAKDEPSTKKVLEQATPQKVVVNLCTKELIYSKENEMGIEEEIGLIVEDKRLKDKSFDHAEETKGNQKKKTNKNSKRKIKSNCVQSCHEVNSIPAKNPIIPEIDTVEHIDSIKCDQLLEIKKTNSLLNPSEKNMKRKSKKEKKGKYSARSSLNLSIERNNAMEDSESEFKLRNLNENRIHLDSDMNMSVFNDSVKSNFSTPDKNPQAENNIIGNDGFKPNSEEFECTLSITTTLNTDHCSSPTEHSEQHKNDQCEHKIFDNPQRNVLQQNPLNDNYFDADESKNVLNVCVTSRCSTLKNDENKRESCEDDRNFKPYQNAPQIGFYPSSNSSPFSSPYILHQNCFNPRVTMDSHQFPPHYDMMHYLKSTPSHYNVMPHKPHAPQILPHPFSYPLQFQQGPVPHSRCPSLLPCQHVFGFSHPANICINNDQMHESCNSKISDFTLHANSQPSLSPHPCLNPSSVVKGLTLSNTTEFGTRSLTHPDTFSKTLFMHTNSQNNLHGNTDCTQNSYSSHSLPSDRHINYLLPSDYDPCDPSQPGINNRELTNFSHNESLSTELNTISSNASIHEDIITSNSNSSIQAKLHNFSSLDSIDTESRIVIPCTSDITSSTSLTSMEFNQSLEMSSVKESQLNRTFSASEPSHLSSLNTSLIIRTNKELSFKDNDWDEKNDSSLVYNEDSLSGMDDYFDWDKGSEVDRMDYSQVDTYYNEECAAHAWNDENDVERSSADLSSSFPFNSLSNAPYGEYPPVDAGKRDNVDYTEAFGGGVFYWNAFDYKKHPFARSGSSLSSEDSSWGKREAEIKMVLDDILAGMPLSDSYPGLGITIPDLRPLSPSCPSSPPSSRDDPIQAPTFHSTESSVGNDHMMKGVDLGGRNLKLVVDSHTIVENSSVLEPSTESNNLSMTVSSSSPQLISCPNNNGSPERNKDTLVVTDVMEKDNLECDLNDKFISKSPDSPLGIDISSSSASFSSPSSLIASTSSSSSSSSASFMPLPRPIIVRSKVKPSNMSNCSNHGWRKSNHSINHIRSPQSSSSKAGMISPHYIFTNHSAMVTEMMNSNEDMSALKGGFRNRPTSPVLRSWKANKVSTFPPQSPTVDKIGVRVRSGSSSPRHWNVITVNELERKANYLQNSHSLSSNVGKNESSEKRKAEILLSNLPKEKLVSDRIIPPESKAILLDHYYVGDTSTDHSLAKLHSTLHGEIEFFQSQVTMEMKARKPFHILAIKKVTRVMQALWPRSRISIFGSNATGLALPSSDIDMVVFLPPVRSLEPIKEAGILEGRNGIKETCLQHASRFLAHQDWVKTDSIKTIENTLVPVIMLVAEVSPELSESEAFSNTQKDKIVLVKDVMGQNNQENSNFKSNIWWEFDDRKRVRLDISFEGVSHTGLKTAELVRELTTQFTAMPPLFFIIKKFLTDRKLDHSYTGGLSSYCLVLLIICFLQNQQKFGRPIQFQNLGSLLMDFFYFFGCVFDPKRICISIRSGGEYILRERNQSIDPLYIEDPLNVTNNVGRNCFRIFQCTKAFADAYALLKETISDFHSFKKETVQPSVDQGWLLSKLLFPPMISPTTP